MREIIVNEKEAGQRLNKFLMKYLNQAPSSFVYKMLRKKNIVLNCAKAKGEEIINAGDSIKLFLAEETIDKFKSNKNEFKKTAFGNNLSLEVIYEDEDIIAITKPVGVLSQKSKPEDYSINEMLLDYLKTKEVVFDTFKPSVCNRLDRNTSGIILAGKSLKGSQSLSRQLKDRTADKYYYTIVYGDFKPQKKYVAYISKDSVNNKSYVIDEVTYNKEKSNAKQAFDMIAMGCKRIDGNRNYTLLRIKLITGKSHQIRAHLNMLGYPIIGDNKYGDAETNRFFRDKYKLKNQLLHAGVVRLADNTIIKSKLPAQFENICDGLGIDKEKIWQLGIQED